MRSALRIQDTVNALRIGFIVCASLSILFQSNLALAASVTEVEMKTLPETIGLEHSDRINRLSRLAALHNISQPKISQIQLAAGQVPGTTYPIPVVRVLFDEGVFFDSDKDTLHNNARQVIALLAESIKHDVPDVKLLVMGHTDSEGSVEYNIDLSKRRAVNIMKMLIAMGIPPESMMAIPIGMAQPIASNATEEGRAKNRRVEFMLSASEDANIHLISLRRVVSDYLPANLAAQNLIMAIPQSVDVVGFKNSGDGTLQKTGQIELQKPSSLSDINLNKPADYKQNSLNDEFVLE